MKISKKKSINLFRKDLALDYIHYDTSKDNKRKLNLGCGRNIIQGYVNVDIFNGPGVDKLVDITKKLPFKDNEFDEIYCRHILNHVSEDDRMNLLDELYRIGKNKGVIKILVPFAWSNGSIGHIQHQSFFVKGSFNYYQPNGGFNDLMKTKTCFKVLREELIGYGRFKRFLPFKSLLSKFLINIYDDIYYKLEIVK